MLHYILFNKCCSCSHKWLTEWWNLADARRDKNSRERFKQKLINAFVVKACENDLNVDIITDSNFQLYIYVFIPLVLRLSLTSASCP